MNTSGVPPPLLHGRQSSGSSRGKLQKREGADGLGRGRGGGRTHRLVHRQLPQRSWRHVLRKLRRQQPSCWRRMRRRRQRRWRRKLLVARTAASGGTSSGSAAGRAAGQTPFPPAVPLPAAAETQPRREFMPPTWLLRPPLRRPTSALPRLRRTALLFRLQLWLRGRRRPAAAPAAAARPLPPRRRAAAVLLKRRLFLLICHRRPQQQRRLVLLPLPQQQDEEKGPRDRFRATALQ